MIARGDSFAPFGNSQSRAFIRSISFLDLGQRAFDVTDGIIVPGSPSDDFELLPDIARDRALAYEKVVDVIGAQGGANKLGDFRRKPAHCWRPLQGSGPGQN